jgi:hypothetical protein
VVALSSERHKDRFIDPDQGYAFAARTNSVYLAASEFALAARHYALVFTRDAEGALVPAALLGLRPDENLMVDDQGGWAAGYVPAYVRRYPFILAKATPDSAQFTVCIDETLPGFNTAREGEPLIDENGEQGVSLSKSVKFFQEFHKHSIITRDFCEALDKAELLESMQARVALDCGANFSLAGLYCVTREKLKALPVASLRTFFTADYLELIYLHMHSMSNLDKLLQAAEGRIARTRTMQ